MEKKQPPIEIKSSSEESGSSSSNVDDESVESLFSACSEVKQKKISNALLYKIYKKNWNLYGKYCYSIHMSNKYLYDYSGEFVHSGFPMMLLGNSFPRIHILYGPSGGKKHIVNEVGINKSQKKENMEVLVYSQKNDVWNSLPEEHEMKFFSKKFVTLMKEYQNMDFDTLPNYIFESHHR